MDTNTGTSRQEREIERERERRAEKIDRALRSVAASCPSACDVCEALLRGVPNPLGRGPGPLAGQVRCSVRQCGVRLRQALRDLCGHADLRVEMPVGSRRWLRALGSDWCEKQIKLRKATIKTYHHRKQIWEGPRLVAEVQVYSLLSVPSEDPRPRPGSSAVPRPA